MRILPALVLLLALPVPALAGDAAPPQIVGGGSTGKLEYRVWGSPQIIHNPVALWVNDKGEVYTAETERYEFQVMDVRGQHGMAGSVAKFTTPNRGSGYFVSKDLPLRTVEDRIALEKSWEAEGYFPKDFFTQKEDVLRLSKDTTGGGAADQSTVFATFGGYASGINSGVMELDGVVYDTCIPNLWKLEDKDGDGKAEVKEILSHGWGVRMSLGGHDFHALTQGPDGRLYFSMADRSFNLTTQEGIHYDLITPGNPGTTAKGSLETPTHRFHHCTGAVFRCWPDGTGLEEVYEGLRNPQGIAFDNLGNLFTGDNTCDYGDGARFCYLADYGTSGWTQDVQSWSGGIWIWERMWGQKRAPHDPEGHAWLVPPIAHIGNGPAGMTHMPGTGHAAKFNDCLLMANFNGGNGQVYAIKADPDGASFKVTANNVYSQYGQVTDIKWGPDGRLYCSNFMGWDLSDKGNVYTVTDPAVFAQPQEKAAIDEVKKILGEGMQARKPAELLALLGHRDQRVRNRAQNELAKRVGDEAQLIAKANDAKQAPLARVHALWTLWQKAGFAQAHKQKPSFGLKALEPLLADADPVLRTQAVRVLGDLRHASPAAYLKLLKDENSQTRFYACIAIGKTKVSAAVAPLFDLLADNADKDAVLLHGASWALAQLAEGTDGAALVRACDSRGADERLGVVLALRHLRSPQLAKFLDDASPQVAAETIRAIYDQEVLAAYPALADSLKATPSAAQKLFPCWRRAIEAAATLGRLEDAKALANVACGEHWPADAKVFALQALADWDKPVDRERVWGHLVNRPGHAEIMAQTVASARAGDLLAAAGKEPKIKGMVGAVLGRHLPKMTPQELSAQALDPARDPAYRMALLDRLDREAPTQSAAVLAQVLAAPPATTTPEMRMQARALLSARAPDLALPDLLKTLEAKNTEATLREKQVALPLLAAMDLPAAKDEMTWQWQHFKQGAYPPELRLDFLEAARTGIDPKIKAEAEAWQKANLYTTGFEGMPQVKPHAILLAGGDPAAGEQLFRNTPTEKSCASCHNAGDKARWDAFDPGHEPDGKGGGFPNLGRVGATYDGMYLLRAIVAPDSDIAPGFSHPSAMPMDFGVHLTAMQIRDLAAFLKTRQGPSAPAAEVSTPLAERGAPHDEEKESSSLGWVFAGMFGFLAVVLGVTVVVSLLTGRNKPKLS